MNYDDDANAMMFTSCFSESHASALQTSIPQARIRDELIRKLASVISNQCISQRVGLFSTEYQLRAYVLTQDQLEKLIHDRASRLFPGRVSVYEVERSAPP